MSEPQVVHEDALKRVAQYRTGSFVWTVEDDSVVITKDVGGSVEPIATYEYKDFETAAEMAWRMAVRQARAVVASNPSGEREPVAYLIASIDPAENDVVVERVDMTNDFRTADKMLEALKGQGIEIIWAGHYENWQYCRNAVRVALHLTLDELDKHPITFLPPLDQTLEPMWRRWTSHNPAGTYSEGPHHESAVTQADVERMTQLGAKMGGDVANLAPEEQEEYHALQAKFERALDEDFTPSSEQTGSESEMGENPPRISGRATRIWHDSEGNTHVRYHNTDVVSFNNRWITLRTGGYDTMTTRRRMQQAAQVFRLPYSVRRDRGTTYVYTSLNRWHELPQKLSIDRQNLDVSPLDFVPPSSDMPTRRRRSSVAVHPHRAGDESEEVRPSRELGFEEGAWEETEKNPPEDGLPCEDNPQTQRVRGVATRIWQDDTGNTHIRYHNTDVVSFNDRWITLRTGGWDTNTTRLRMNQAANQFDLPYRVYRSRGETYVKIGDQDYQFVGTLSIVRHPVLPDDVEGRVTPEDMVPPTSPMPRHRSRASSADAVPTASAQSVDEFLRANCFELCRRTDFPKLGYIIHRLNEQGIPSLLHGESGHAENILWVPNEHGEAANTILGEDVDGVVLDEAEDDDDRFDQYADTRPEIPIPGLPVQVRASVGERIRDSVRRRTEERERVARGQQLGFKEGEWESTEKNPPEADVLVNDHGSVVIIMPMSGAAKDWWQSNVQEAQRWGGGYVVEPRYAEAIIQGMQEAGFSVSAR